MAVCVWIALKEFATNANGWRCDALRPAGGEWLVVGPTHCSNSVVYCMMNWQLTCRQTPHARVSCRSGESPHSSNLAESLGMSLCRHQYTNNSKSLRRLQMITLVLNSASCVDVLLQNENHELIMYFPFYSVRSDLSVQARLCFENTLSDSEKSWTEKELSVLLCPDLTCFILRSHPIQQVTESDSVLNWTSSWFRTCKFAHPLTDRECTIGSRLCVWLGVAVIQNLCVHQIDREVSYRQQII